MNEYLIKTDKECPLCNKTVKNVEGIVLDNEVDNYFNFIVFYLFIILFYL